MPRTVTKLVPYRLTKIQKENKSEASRQLTRDERAVRDLNIPYSMHFIINCSMEEFNDILNNKSLYNKQVNLCRDIRKRGKNKVNSEQIEKKILISFIFRLLHRIVGIEKGRLIRLLI